MDNTQQASAPNTQQPTQPPMQPSQQSTQAVPTPSSPSKLYIIIGIIILVIPILGTFLISKISNPNTPVPMEAPTQNATRSTPTPQANSALPPGNSDTQLNQDLQSIDTSLNSADNIIENVDQGLNDQQTNLTE